jgi:hypothetical protein
LRNLSIELDIRIPGQKPGVFFMYGGITSLKPAGVEVVITGPAESDQIIRRLKHIKKFVSASWLILEVIIVN